MVPDTAASLSCSRERGKDSASPHTTRAVRSMIEKRAPVDDCCANTPRARAQLGASFGSSPSAAAAAFSAFMSPTNSMAIARAVSMLVTRNLARASASVSRVVCSVAAMAMSASGNRLTLRIRNSLAPVGSRASQGNAAPSRVSAKRGAV